MVFFCSLPVFKKVDHLSTLIFYFYRYTFIILNASVIRLYNKIPFYYHSRFFQKILYSTVLKIAFNTRITMKKCMMYMFIFMAHVALINGASVDRAVDVGKKQASAVAGNQGAAVAAAAAQAAASSSSASSSSSSAGASSSADAKNTKAGVAAAAAAAANQGANGKQEAATQQIVSFTVWRFENGSFRFREKRAIEHVSVNGSLKKFMEAQINPIFGGAMHCFRDQGSFGRFVECQSSQKPRPSHITATALHKPVEVPRQLDLVSELGDNATVQDFLNQLPELDDKSRQLVVSLY
jgi:hypothetical protein